MGRRLRGAGGGARCVGRRGRPRERPRPGAHLAARAKWTASEAACANADRCLQIHGGWGYDVSVGIERALRDARVTRLDEGTNEMQKLQVARHAVGSVS